MPFPIICGMGARKTEENKKLFSLESLNLNGLCWLYFVSTEAMILAVMRAILKNSGLQRGLNARRRDAGVTL